jgi:hypothetical protein
MKEKCILNLFIKFDDTIKTYTLLGHFLKSIFKSMTYKFVVIEGNKHDLY